MTRSRKPKAKKSTKSTAIAHKPPAKIIASCIHKGGTGKTTIAVHLVHYLADAGHRVLLVDCDTQGNATQVFIDEVDPNIKGASELFKPNGKPDVLDGGGTVVVVPADEDLTSIDFAPQGEKHFASNLRKLAAQIAADYVVIDTPPTMQMGMLAPLVASDFAFSPFKPDPFGFRGISSLVKRIDQIREQYNPNLVYLGLLINLWNRRNADANTIVEALESDMADRIIPHKIGDRAAIARVAFLRAPVWSGRSGAAGVATREMRGALSYIVKATEAKS